MFEIGDVVEAIRDCKDREFIFGFRKGQKFVVNHVSSCLSCKDVFYDIGLPFKKPPIFKIVCDCGAKSESTKNPHYSEVFFRKLPPLYKVVEVSETIKKQDLILS